MTAVSDLNHLSNSCPKPPASASPAPAAESDTPAQPGLAGGDCRKAMGLLDNAVMSVLSSHREQAGKKEPGRRAQLTASIALMEVNLLLGTRGLLQPGREHRLWLPDALCVDANAEGTFFKHTE